MKLCLLSDSHGHTPKIDEDTDLILHAGDFTHTGRSISNNFHQWYKIVFPWLKKLSSHSKVIGVFGNHDWCATKYPITEECKKYNIDILEHGYVEWNGLTISCSSWQPIFYDWAFNTSSERLQKLYRELSPCDILLTHCPAWGRLDISPYGWEHVGSVELSNELPRLKPRLHCFGHIHHTRGVRLEKETLFINSSIVDEEYKTVHQPIYLEFE